MTPEPGVFTAGNISIVVSGATFLVVLRLAFLSGRFMQRFDTMERTVKRHSTIIKDFLGEAETEHGE